MQSARGLGALKAAGMSKGLIKKERIVEVVF